MASGRWSKVGSRWLDLMVLPFVVVGRSRTAAPATVTRHGSHHIEPSTIDHRPDAIRYQPAEASRGPTTSRSQLMADRQLSPPDPLEPRLRILIKCSDPLIALIDRATALRPYGPG